MHRVVLAATLHDPEGRMYEQAERVRTALMQIYAGVTILATPTTGEPMVTLMAQAGALVSRDVPDAPMGLATLGRARRLAVALALKTDAAWVHFCDFDRIIHWAEYEPAELARVTELITEQDFTVLGRTGRAFASHPRVQRDTEAITNHVFATISGHEWDIATASRGLSRRAATMIASDVTDDSIGTDGSWPLALMQRGGFTLGYLETEGLEFETADRFGDQVRAAGGLDAWIQAIDTDPHQWVERIEIARLHVAAMMPYKR